MCRAFIHDKLNDYIDHFNFTVDKCFCSDCFPVEDETYTAGDMVTAYPKGFCRLGYRILEAEFEKRKDWCISYHGTSVKFSALLLLIVCAAGQNHKRDRMQGDIDDSWSHAPGRARSWVISY